jgi:hypothetical protein
MTVVKVGRSKAELSGLYDPLRIRAGGVTGTILDINHCSGPQNQSSATPVL